MFHMKISNNSTNRCATVLASALILGFSTAGCKTTEQIVDASLANCTDAYAEGRSKIQNSFDDALACCKDLLPDNPQGYLECVEKVEEARQKAQESLNEAHQACVAANRELLTAHIDMIKQIVEDAIKLACELTDVFNVTQSEDGRVANVTDNSEHIEAVSIKLSGNAFSMHDVPGEGNSGRVTVRMNGAIGIVGEDGASYVPSSVRFSSTLPANNHLPGQIQNFSLTIAGMGSYESASSVPSTLKRTDNGGYLICVTLKEAGTDILDPDSSPQAGLYLEIPLTINGQRAKAGTNGNFVNPQSLAPVAPNGIADWQRDFTVDMTDYAAFLEDFAQGVIDLNADGETNDLDFEIFEDRFWSEFEG